MYDDGSQKKPKHVALLKRQQNSVMYGGNTQHYRHVNRLESIFPKPRDIDHATLLHLLLQVFPRAETIPHR
jgi:hypothetical protein